MIPSADRRDQSPGWLFILSLALHILALFICSNTSLFRPTLREVTPYYVDIVSLPAIDATSSEPEGQQAVSSPTPAPASSPKTPAVLPKTPVAPAMTVPVKSPPRQVPPAAPSPGSEEQEAKEFAERMSRLEHRSEAKHQAAALESIQKKAADQKRSSAGGGAAKGTGSDYGAYVQSRLKDALGSTIVYRSQNPEAAVHLYIDKRGKLIKYVVLRPSPDKLFNDSVIRTIEKAKSNFPPNPAGADFDKLFVFSPQEVSK
jgi:colicin import membrane protein